MKIKTLIVGEEQTNCYVIYEDKIAVVIDPGDNYKKINKFLLKEELNVCAILLTHGHLDHTMVVDRLVDEYKCDVYLDKEDFEFTKFNKKIEGSFTITSRISDYPNVLKINNWEFEVIKTPGHTYGSVCLKLGEFLFTGDTIFEDGVGRYDLYGSDKRLLFESIDQLKANYSGMVCYPGHDNIFTL